jgi:hypothetical protein
MHDVRTMRPENAYILADALPIRGAVRTVIGIEQVAGKRECGESLGKVTAARQDDGKAELRAVKGNKLIAQQRARATNVGIGQHVHNVKDRMVHRREIFRGKLFSKKVFPEPLSKKLWINFGVEFAAVRFWI